MPGARTYDVQVAIDQDFNNITRASPTSRARATPRRRPWTTTSSGGASGRSTWPASRRRGRTSLLRLPAPVARPAAAGLPEGPGTRQLGDDRQALHPVDAGPARHLLRALTASNPQMTRRREGLRGRRDDVRAPQPDGDCGLDADADRYWEVRADRRPLPERWRPGRSSRSPQAFSWTTRWHRPASHSTSTLVVTGLKVAVDGTARSTTPARAAWTVRNSHVHLRRCPATPVFSWDPVPGATSYHVNIAQDVNFTTSEMPDGITHVPDDGPRVRRQRRDPAESQAGSAYYWHVAACWTGGCTHVARVAHPTPARASRRSARRRPPSAGLSAATPTPARSRSPGRTTSTRTTPPSGAGSRQTKSAKTVPDPGRHRPVVRDADRHRGWSTRRHTPRSTTCTRTGTLLLARAGLGRRGTTA